VVSRIQDYKRDEGWASGSLAVAWRLPSAAKAAIDFAALTARLKPRPFKAKSKPEFFRRLLEDSPRGLRLPSAAKAGADN